MRNVNKFIFVAIFISTLLFILLTLSFVAFDDYTVTLNIQNKANILFLISLVLNLCLICYYYRFLRTEFICSKKIFVILLCFQGIFFFGYIIFKNNIYNEGLRLRVSYLRNDNEKLLNQSVKIVGQSNPPFKINWISFEGRNYKEVYFLDGEVFLCLISFTKEKEEYLIYCPNSATNIKYVLEKYFKLDNIAIHQCIPKWYSLVIDKS